MSSLLAVGKIVLAVGLLSVGLIYLDFRSLLLEVRRNRCGHGSSGVAYVAIPLYASGIWLLPQCVFGLHKGGIFIALLILHFSCHFIVPIIHRRLITK